MKHSFYGRLNNFFFSITQSVSLSSTLVFRNELNFVPDPKSLPPKDTGIFFKCMPNHPSIDWESLFVVSIPLSVR